MILNTFFHYTTLSIYLANSGVPLFTQSIFYQFFLLIPIIVIEAYIHRIILQLTVTRSLSIAFSTNFISTLVGGLFLTMIFSHYCCLPHSFPLLPLELMVTLIPMFFLSILIESALGHLTLKQVDKSKINRSFLKANIYTYLMLEILAVTQLIKGYLEGYG
ncbi:MAG: hypothetical protein WBF52_00105 [Geitlerinemataceae cyanobacterium]